MNKFTFLNVVLYKIAEKARSWHNFAKKKSMFVIIFCIIYFLNSRSFFFFSYYYYCHCGRNIRAINNGWRCFLLLDTSCVILFGR